LRDVRVADEVKFRHPTVRYGAKTAVNDLSVEILARGLLGPNGAGKTTLIKPCFARTP